MKKLYQRFWSKEGFLWRRWNYVIIPPHDSVTTWELRRIYGKPGKQKQEAEGSFDTERAAFRAGNKLIKKIKHEDTDANA